jgi:uncharacterized damage-inducible protein DinB
MNRQSLDAMWEQFRAINGVTLRALERIPEDKLGACPVGNMRSTRELVDHIYGYLRAIPQAVLKGQITAEDVTPRSERLQTKRDMMEYARECFRQADEAASKITDAHLARMVATHWGPEFPGAMMMTVLYDEHLHHRGQLYTYLRALGVEPPFIWGFNENETAFQPRTAKV